MPGRQDFAIVRSELLADERAHTAATLYVEHQIAAEQTSLAAVIGHVAMLGLWAMRETDDGVLPGDAMAAMRFAIGAPTSVLKTIRDALTDAKLLRKRRKGFYLVGFRDCYAPITTRRKRDAKRKRKHRNSLEMSAGRPLDVPETSEGCPGVPNHTQPDRIQPNLTTTITNQKDGRDGGGGEVSWWTAGRALAVDVILAELRAGNGGRQNAETAAALTEQRKAGTLPADVGKSILDRWGSTFARQIGAAKAKRGGA